MGANLVRTNFNIYTISTSRLLVIPTSPITKVVMLNSASIGISITNLGPSVLAWSDTNVLASTGGLIFYSQIKEWMPVVSGFSMYFVADSVAGVLLVNEYKA